MDFKKLPNLHAVKIQLIKLFIMMFMFKEQDFLGKVPNIGVATSGH